MSLRLIRGLPCLDVSWLLPKNIEDAMDYIPHDGDILITSFPKTGTTWLNYIALHIVSQEEMYPSLDDLGRKCTPLMEMTGVSAVEALTEPRIYRHHCPYSLVQKNEKAKFLYIYRHPEDVLISYYHFIQNLRNITLDFDAFFEDFVKGNVGCGLYFDHVASFLAHKEDENLLLISYEKLHANRKEEILRIAKFLGDEYYRSLSRNESLLDQVIERTSFDYMKKHLSAARPLDEKTESSSSKAGPLKLLRKGIVGDGKKSLSPTQLERLKEIAVHKLKGSEVINEWYKD